jgi:hypothetical protein
VPRDRELRLESFETAVARWPSEGKRVLAQHDAAELVVYQAFNARVASAAVERQRLDVPGFSFDRMSWVKPSFLWMMYRCGWCTKDQGQERVLAIWLPRARFESLLARAVVTPFVARPGWTEADWKRAVAATEVRIQWDPDRTPAGERDRGRRAIQVGLSGSSLREYACECIVHIEDITEFVDAQRAHRHDVGRLLVPVQDVMQVHDPIARGRVELDE